MRQRQADQPSQLLRPAAGLVERLGGHHRPRLRAGPLRVQPLHAGLPTGKSLPPGGFLVKVRHGLGACWAWGRLVHFHLSSRCTKGTLPFVYFPETNPGYPAALRCCVFPGSISRPMIWTLSRACQWHSLILFLFGSPEMARHKNNLQLGPMFRQVPQYSHGYHHLCNVQNLRLHVYQGLCHIDPWRKQNRRRKQLSKNMSCKHSAQAIVQSCCLEYPMCFFSHVTMLFVISMCFSLVMCLSYLPIGPYKAILSFATTQRKTRECLGVFRVRLT